MFIHRWNIWWKGHGKEFRGILLVVACMLWSTQGWNLLKTRPNFANPAVYKDWVLLVEMLLQWEADLNEAKMSVHDI
jgi:hypothetical protein